MLAAYIGVAASYDLKCKRIPNALIISGLAAGIIHTYETGASGGLGATLGNIFFPILLLFFFFLIRVIGAGDIKLFAVLAVFVGKDEVLRIMVLAFLVGGVYAFIKLSKKRALFWRMLEFRQYMRDCLLRRKLIAYTSYSQSDVMCFSVTIFIGYAVAEIFGSLGEGNDFLLWWQ